MFSDYGKAEHPAFAGHEQTLVELERRVYDQFSGLDLHQFAHKTGMSADQVLERVHDGELIARQVNGKMMIFTTLSLEAELATSHADLPPLPATPPPPPTSELALLLDHLSLAKEENREILRFSQESMQQLSRLTEANLQLKDQLLDAKAREVETLQHQVSSQEATIRKLKQELDDLAMLVKLEAPVTRQKKPTKGLSR